jgi:hypothetical protein
VKIPHGFSLFLSHLNVLLLHPSSLLILDTSLSDKARFVHRFARTTKASIYQQDSRQLKPSTIFSGEHLLDAVEV